MESSNIRKAKMEQSVTGCDLHTLLTTLTESRALSKLGSDKLTDTIANGLPRTVDRLILSRTWASEKF